MPRARPRPRLFGGKARRGWPGRITGSSPGTAMTTVRARRLLALGHAPHRLRASTSVRTGARYSITSSARTSSAGGNSELERLRCFHVHHELEPGRLLDRQVCGPFTLEDPCRRTPPRCGAARRGSDRRKRGHRTRHTRRRSRSTAPCILRQRPRHARDEQKSADRSVRLRPASGGCFLERNVEIRRSRYFQILWGGGWSGG